MNRLELGPQKPFIVKAYYEWFLHNGLPVNFQLQTEGYACNVPSELIEDGIATINMHPQNIKNFDFVDGLHFQFKYCLGHKWVFVKFPAELINEMFVLTNEYERKSLFLNEYESDLSRYKVENVIDNKISVNSDTTNNIINTVNGATLQIIK